MLVRSMSPEILAVDEIGSEEDREAIEYAIHSGVTVIATAHGDALEDIQSKEFFWFKKIVLLGKSERAGEIRGIFDDRGNRIC